MSETHDLKPIETTPSPYIGHTVLYRQPCACGWTTKWYVHKGNATKRAESHQRVNQ